MNKMPCSITDGPKCDDEQTIPEIEFIRVAPTQIGGLPERITLALNDYHNDNADIDVLVMLLEESLNTLEQASKSIMSLADEIDETCDEIQAKTYQGKQA